MTHAKTTMAATLAKSSAPALLELLEVFHRMESALDLFARTVDDVPFWDWLRAPLHAQTMQALGLQEGAQEEPDRSLRGYLANLRGILASVIRRSPFRGSPAGLLCIGHPRRQHREDQWWDIYCDPVIEEVAGPVGLSPLLWERPFQNRHRTPARTENIRHLDGIALRSALRRQLRPFRLTAKDHRLLGDIARTLWENLGVRIDVVALCRRHLHLRRSQIDMYRRLLQRVRPRLVLVVVSYGNETIIEACRALGIPTAELQHGIIGPAHPGYSFPDPTRRKKNFPDYFFAFGDFWKNNVALPIPPERILSIGFPHLERERQRFADAPRSRQILFLSQRSIGRELSRSAARLASSRTVDAVVYKLHPGEFRHWRREYPWLLEAPLTVIADDRASVYRHLAQSTIQIGVYSTAIFEGLAFGLETYLYALPGIEFMDALIAREPSVHVVRSVEELTVKLGATPFAPPVDPDPYFRPGAIENLRQAIEGILAGEL